MFRNFFLISLATLLSACGVVRQNPQAATTPAVAGTPGASAAPNPFVSQWCNREFELSAAEALTIGVLVAAAGSSDCASAAKVLSEKTSLELGDASLVMKLTDLRPLASFPRLKALKLKNLFFHLWLTMFLLKWKKVKTLLIH
jgi:hypothetical protein